MRSLTTLPLLGLFLVALSACSSEPNNPGTGTGGGGGSGGAGGGGGGSAAICTMPSVVPCSDQAILGLNYQKTTTPALIQNAPDGTGFLSTIDATAGGFGAPMPTSYTYGKFTDQGLVKVEISDEQSLDSMDWDIAFRRFVVRINSGNSGPSCVSAAPLAPATKYDDVMAPPENIPFSNDEYFSAGCEVIPDGNGLGTPNTILNGYWSYKTCVKMTDRAFVIRLADGRFLKYTVDSYYSPAVQDQCDTTGMIPMSNTGSANFRVRWAFLP